MCLFQLRRLSIRKLRKVVLVEGKMVVPCRVKERLSGSRRLLQRKSKIIKMVVGELIRNFMEKSQSMTALHAIFSLDVAVVGSEWLQAIFKSLA
jgi:hypothetical protein